MAAQFAVLGIDIIGYSKLALPQQVAAQDSIDHFLSDAIEEVSIETKPHWIDAGDGGYLLLKDDLLKALDILELFQTKLATDNKTRTSTNAILVRCALHLDQVDIRQKKLGLKFTGNAINICARLLAGMPRNNEYQVVCSEKFFTELSAFANHKEAIVRLKDVKDKHGQLHPLYNLKRVRMGIEPPHWERHPDPLKRFP